MHLPVPLAVILIIGSCWCTAPVCAQPLRLGWVGSLPPASDGDELLAQAHGPVGPSVSPLPWAHHDDVGHTAASGQLLYHVDATGFLSVRPFAREAAGEIWLRTLGIGRTKSSSCSLIDGQVSTAGRTLSRRAGPIEETLEVLEAGLHQVWRVALRPPGEGPLMVNLQLTGGEIEVVSEDELSFVTRHGWGLGYTGLRVWDARGVELSASMQGRGDQVTITVQDDSALYPVTIDPVLAGPFWLQPGLAGKATGAGDVNGDGFDDVLYGTTMLTGTPCHGGQAGLFQGYSFGLESTLAWQVEAPFCGNNFGLSVAGAGDVNGDGLADVLVHMGIADGYLFYYPGVSSFPPVLPTWEAFGEPDASGFGRVISTAGDVNADGFDDIIVGDTGHVCGTEVLGKAFLFLGSASGPGLAAAWSVCGALPLATLGRSVAAAGDVNGDGYDDVILGEDGHGPIQGANYGRALVFHGSPLGLPLIPDWTFEGNAMHAHLGWSVAGAGDVNGDGYADVLVGQRGPAVSTGGFAYLFLGSSTGLASIPAWTTSIALVGSQYGWDVAGLGDIDGDGYDDIAVSAPRYDSDRGRVDIFLGSATGPGSDPDMTIIGEEPNFGVGREVEPAGDVNGDGLADVLINVPGELANTSPPPFGILRLYFGVQSFDFRRGDPNGDGAINIADAINVLATLFVPGTAPLACSDAADTNDDGTLNVADAIYLLAYLFVHSAPAPPDPGPVTCGVDPTPDNVPCDQAACP